MKYLLDTNACITWLRNKNSNISDRIQQLQPTDIVLCSIVVAELLFGVQNSDQKYRDQSAKQISLLCERFESIPFDDQAANSYALIRSHLSTLGQMIGANDLLIASIAVANHCILITNNIREFSRIPDLLYEKWQSE